MLRPRIIPCLLIHKGGLVKTQFFDNPKYVGDPINTVRIFSEKLVDELIVLDIDATVNKYKSMTLNPLYNIIATPTIIVNDQYIVNPALPSRLIEVINALVNKTISGK